MAQERMGLYQRADKSNEVVSVDWRHAPKVDSESKAKDEKEN
jgi:hypothetical protein